MRPTDDGEQGNSPRASFASHASFASRAEGMGSDRSICLRRHSLFDMMPVTAGKGSSPRNSLTSNSLPEGRRQSNASLDSVRSYCSGGSLFALVGTNGEEVTPNLNRRPSFFSFASNSGAIAAAPVSPVRRQRHGYPLGVNAPANPQAQPAA